jgi:hypothetical protein
MFRSYLRIWFVMITILLITGIIILRAVTARIDGPLISLFDFQLIADIFGATLVGVHNGNDEKILKKTQYIKIVD